jgi:putative addiction module killer protein
MLELREYVDELGRSRYARWRETLDVTALVRVSVAVDRLSTGNLSNVKSVGAGVLELKIQFGPGYRVYFGRDGERLVLLLGGGTKRTQPEDIERARNAWRAYKWRKAEGDI